MTKTEYTVFFSNGDRLVGKMNAAPETVRKLFPVGSLHNIGLGPADNIQKVAAVVIYDENTDAADSKENAAGSEFTDEQMLGYTE